MMHSRRSVLALFALAVGLPPRPTRANPLPLLQSRAARRAAAWLGRRCHSCITPLATPLADDPTQIRAAIRADFAEGRTKLVDGWLLSETEAVLYARAAALKRGSRDA